MTWVRHSLVWLCLAAVAVTAQSVAQSAGGLPASNSSRSHPGISYDDIEAARVHCIEERRIICGKIVKLLPDGLVVESGYTNLMRRPLENLWLIPGTVEARRERALVERRDPDCPAIGLVYLTETPKSRRLKPKPGDYVVMEAFPDGMFHYRSVGAVQRTVRHFSGSLAVAVRSEVNAAAGAAIPR